MDEQRKTIVDLVVGAHGLNLEEKALIEKIVNSNRGQILRKGKVERILYGMDHMFILYMTKRSKSKVTALNIKEFLKWAEKAEFIS